MCKSAALSQGTMAMVLDVCPSLWSQCSQPKSHRNHSNILRVFLDRIQVYFCIHFIIAMAHVEIEKSIYFKLILYTSSSVDLSHDPGLLPPCKPGK